MLIDAQLHEPSVWLDWRMEDNETRQRLLAELTLAAMDTVGVEGAVLFPVWEDAWARELIARDPERFRWVPNITADAATMDAEAEVAAAVRRQDIAGWRLALVRDEPLRQYNAGAFEPVLSACEKHGLPLFVLAWGLLDLIDEIAARYPRLCLIIDHFGIPQPPMVRRDTPPLVRLPRLIELARHPCVAVKFCGAILFSDEPYPHADVWPELRRLVDAFGAGRLMWASDISRVRGQIGDGVVETVMGDNPWRHTYAEALNFVRDTNHLSAGEKDLILGGAAARLLGFTTHPAQTV